MSESSRPVPVDPVVGMIRTVRGERVILDQDIARLYGVSTSHLTRQVRRNLDRFPADFMFRLTDEEHAACLRCQSGISNTRGGRRYLPYAFTEQGVAMLSGVLRSGRAIRANIEIMRAFVRLRRWLVSHEVFARRLENLERKYDHRFKVVFDAIRELMNPHPAKKKRRIGFE